MSDTIVVAISQSGTTTDTNRTVDLARARGAAVVAIVNRRQSDLVDKSDGVLYTSDGRDVEMSVASTKAFYAQLAAGVLLALRLAAELGADGVAERAHRSGVLEALRELPDAMHEVFARRPAIALAAQRHPLQRRSWAVVGNGVNRIAALELRIKLSELCYKSIACDVTEDKKHIDLSSEPHDSRVRGGAARLQRRRRGQGGRDLPRAQGGADRDRRRRRDAFRVGRDRDDRGSVGSSVARLRALRARRSPLRLRSRARHRRVGPAVARSARLHRGAGRFGGGRARSARRADGRPRTARRAILREPARRQLRRQPRSAHRGAARVDAALRDRRRAARRVPGRLRQGRHAERRGRGSHRGAHEGDRGADAPGRRDQASGEDGHGRDLAVRRDVAAGPARARGARDGYGARQPQLPRAAHVGRARRRGGVGDRLDAVSHRRRSARGRDGAGRRPRRDRARHSLAYG